MVFVSCFGFSQIQTCNALKQKLENKYKINIYDKYNIDFFPAYWLEPPYNLQASGLKDEKEKLVLNCINKVLKNYPNDLIWSTITSVYLLDSVVFSGGYKLPPVYTNNQCIYIICDGLENDTLGKKFKEEFENVFFEYFPGFENPLGKISDDIKVEFKDSNIKKSICDEFSKTSQKYGVNIHFNTNIGDVPAFLRQKPYNDIIVGKNDNSIIDVLPVLEKAISCNPVGYRSLINNIYLFRGIFSNGTLVPSVSYFSDIYLSVFDTTGAINEENILNELNTQMCNILIQNILADVSLEKWRSFSNTDTDSIYNIADDIQNIRNVFASFYKSKYEGKTSGHPDAITELKYSYLNDLLNVLYQKLAIINEGSIKTQCEELENRYNVNILYNFDFPFQNEGCTLPSGLTIFSNPNPYQLKRILNNIDSALWVYPVEMINKYLSSIYIVESMLYNNKQQIGPAGTYSLFNKSLYLSNIGSSDSSLQKAFHHEFSSLVRRLSDVQFPKNEWISINDSAFSYYYEKKDAVRIKEEDLLEQGFLEEYSTTLFDNDVEVFTSWLFYKPKELAVVAQSHSKVLGKLKILYLYYKMIDSKIDFDNDIERLVNC